MARIRYRQPLQKATIYQFEDAFYIEFEEPQSAIAEGQFAAWYDGEETLEAV
jgi:tRNA-specific 2-thiouridylase